MIIAEKLFFELIQVALGTRICLSHTPSSDEWSKFYQMAKKQSLVGICFAGVQRLQSQQQEPPEMLYLTWMGMAAKIQQRNEVVNQQCVGLIAKLSADGFRSCILKGQGVANLYDEHLRGLRQSGDIDLWVVGNIKDTIRKFEQIGVKLTNVNIKHADARFFEDTEVEIHFRPSWFYSPLKDSKLRKWFDAQSDLQMNNCIGKFVAPSTDFNLVYLLLHIYRHMLDEGVGLRQLMDYYFALKQFKMVSDRSKLQEVLITLKELGLMKFAGAMMWVMKAVFCFPTELQICEPNEKLGRMLLEDVLKAGNFGHGNKRKTHYSNAWLNGLENLKRNLRYLSYYPSEVLWAPMWKAWHLAWRKKNKY